MTMKSYAVLHVILGIIWGVPLMWNPEPWRVVSSVALIAIGMVEFEQSRRARRRRAAQLAELRRRADQMAWRAQHGKTAPP